MAAAAYAYLGGAGLFSDPEAANRANTLARRSIDIVPSLAEGAFEAVLAGDTARHDNLLTASLERLLKEVDVLVLAQASMARVIPQMRLNGGPPILSSPELAVKRARDLFIPAPVSALQ